MSKRFAAAAVVALVTSTPALADEFHAVTPSGATEALFAAPPQEVVGTLSAKCVDAGWSIVSSTATEVVCEAPMNFGQELIGQLLMGNSYSTPPRRFFKYNIATVNGVSRVQASGWMELQMAFGQVRRTDFAGPEFHNGAMNFLGAAGGKFPKGTSFPNHVFLGLNADTIAHGKFQALRVTAVPSGSAAEQGGVLVGDVITSIAQKRFKSGGAYLDAAAKAAKSSTFPVEVLRDGKTVKLTLPRVFRSNYEEQVVGTPPVAAATGATAPVSVADELGKLAKLKADGLITQAEFDQQKAKLLAR